MAPSLALESLSVMMVATEASATLSLNHPKLPSLLSRWVVKKWTAVKSDLTSQLAEVPAAVEAVVASIAEVEAVSEVVTVVVSVVALVALEVVTVVVSAVASEEATVVASEAVIAEVVAASEVVETDEASIIKVG